jgi:hypothetical protein
MIGTDIGAMRAPGNQDADGECRGVEGNRGRVRQKPAARCLGPVVLAFQAVNRSATSKTASEVGLSRKDHRLSGAVTTPAVALHESAGKPWPGLRSVSWETRRIIKFTITYYHLLSFLAWGDAGPVCTKCVATIWS